MVAIEKIQAEILKSIERYGKKLGVPKTDIQVVLGLNSENGQVSFTVLKNYRKELIQTVEDVLGIRKMPILNTYIDPFNLREVVPSYISCALIVSAEKYGSNLDNTTAMLMHNKKEGNKEAVLVFIYEGNTCKATITLADLFSDENVMKVVAMQGAQNG